MGILQNTQEEYYTGNNLGNYQFTSLEDVINQFMIAYVGEEKIISKANRTDVQFHAMRSLAELSFDTFKSVKSQEIELPPSLIMPLPHDYVNYTRVLSVDNSGIKHPLYPTKHTQNPFKILQNDDKSYDFTYPSDALLIDSNFTDNANVRTAGTPWIKNSTFNLGTDDISVIGQVLTFEHSKNAPVPGTSDKTSRAYAVYQEIDVTDVDFLDLQVIGSSAAAEAGQKGVGTLRVGISALTFPGFDTFRIQVTNPNKTTNGSINNTNAIFDVFTQDGDRALLTFNDGLETFSTQTLTNVDVSLYDTVYVLITSFIENFTGTSTNSFNKVDDITLTIDAISSTLQDGGESTTWSRYKSHRPNENIQHDYDYNDHVFEANVGRRYGIEPSHAQDNGSYYIDNLRGNIHFSSNLSGQTIVLDYISDSLGTDDEMQVHKFAEEAMYKSIIYAILSTRMRTPEYIVRRFKKEKFAAIRKAKLRLSNIKLEEITQIFRGKSKQIKH